MKTDNETLVIPSRKERIEVVKKMKQSGTRFIALFVSRGERKIHELHYKTLKGDSSNEKYARHGLIPVFDLQKKIRTTVDPKKVRFIVLDGVRYRFPLPKTDWVGVAKKAPATVQMSAKIKAKDVPEIAKRVIKKRRVSKVKIEEAKKENPFIAAAIKAKAKEAKASKVEKVTLDKPKKEEGKIIKTVKVKKQPKASAALAEKPAETVVMPPAYDYESELLRCKKVTEADKKFVAKYIAPKIRPDDARVYNPFTTWEKISTPLVAALVHFIQELIYNDFRKEWLDKWGVPEGQKIQLFDRARYLILKLDNEVYMNVID